MAVCVSILSVYNVFCVVHHVLIMNSSSLLQSSIRWDAAILMTAHKRLCTHAERSGVRIEGDRAFVKQHCTGQTPLSTFFLNFKNPILSFLFYLTK